MSREKNNGKESGKITKFPYETTQEENLEDEKMDAFLRESIIKEADELEAHLNSDPKLVGVGASDDLFDKIVGSLKEQGVWEETPKQYQELSEADRKAMEYGYQMQAKDEARKNRWKARRKVLRKISGTAAACAVVFLVSMTSEANRRYVLEAWNGVVENLGMRTTVNYLEDDALRELSEEEVEAQRRIREELGIDPIKLGYLPEDWKFVSCEIDENAEYGIVFYSDGNLWFNIYMQKGQQDNVSYYQLDGEDAQEEIIVNEQGIKIKLSQTGDGKEESYSAVFYDGENSYYCNGSFSYIEMVEIIKYIIVLRG